MKIHLLKSFLYTLFFVIFVSCDKKNQDPEPELKLEKIGFLGTLPDGKTISEANLVATTELTSSSSTNEGSHITHILSITDPAAGISLKVELPRVKYSNNFISGTEGDGAAMKQKAREFYPYAKVKEMLVIDNKPILSSQSPDITNSFRLLLIDQKNFKGYTTEGTQNQGGSILKVKELLEGTETDAALGQVKTLEVLFEVDAKLYPSDPATSQTGNLKGLLRMKFTEQ